MLSGMAHLVGDVDGAVVVVDSVEGLNWSQHQSLTELMEQGVRPILFINKLDRWIIELQDLEACYLAVVRVIESFNAIIAGMSDARADEWQVDARAGTVVFGSALQGWAFTLSDFAHRYAVKFGVPEDRMCNRLFGDWYFDAAGKKWVSSPMPAVDPQQQRQRQQPLLRRSFVEFILVPIERLIVLIVSNTGTIDSIRDRLDRMLAAIHVQLPDADYRLPPRQLVRRVMARFLPLDQSLLRAVACTLPAPIVAQTSRVAAMYSGPLDDAAAESIRSCAPDGVLMALGRSCVARSTDASAGWIEARVLSGTMRVGSVVHVLHRLSLSSLTPREQVLAQCRPPPELDRIAMRVRAILILLLDGYRSLPQAGPGSVVVVQLSFEPGETPSSASSASALLSQCSIPITITDSLDAHVLCEPQSQRHQTLAVAIELEACDPTQREQFLRAMPELSRQLNCVYCTWDAELQAMLNVSGSLLHSRVCAGDLQARTPIRFRLLEPLTPVRECVTIAIDRAAALESRSPDGHVRMSVCARPISDYAIETLSQHRTASARRLSAILECNVWSHQSFNLLVCHIDEAQPAEQAAHLHRTCIRVFQQAVARGFLCNEPLRHVEFSIVSYTLTQSPPVRAIERAFMMALEAAFLQARPTLIEPLARLEIVTPAQVRGEVYQCLALHQADIEDEEDRPGGAGLVVIKATLGIHRSTQCISDLRTHSHGQAFAHTQITEQFQPLFRDDGDLNDPATPIGAFVAARRLRRRATHNLVSL